MLTNIDFTFTDKHNKLVRDTAAVFAEIYNKTAWYGWLHRYRDHNKLFSNFIDQVRSSYALYPTALTDAAVRNAAKDTARSVVMCDGGLPTLDPRRYRPMMALTNSTVKYNRADNTVRLLLVGGYKDVSVTPLSPLHATAVGKVVKASVYELNNTMCLRLAIEECTADDTAKGISRSAIKKWSYESSWGRITRT